MGDGITPLQNRALDDDAFAVDPVEHATTRRAIRAEGRVVVALYHSHPHGHATLSRRDQAFLVVDGAPLFPDEWAIVVAPSADAEVALRAFTWAVGGFQECPIAWISGGAPIGTSRSA